MHIDQKQGNPPLAAFAEQVGPQFRFGDDGELGLHPVHEAAHGPGQIVGHIGVADAIRKQLPDLLRSRGRPRGHHQAMVRIAAPQSAHEFRGGAHFADGYRVNPDAPAALDGRTVAEPLRPAGPIRRILQSPPNEIEQRVGQQEIHGQRPQSRGWRGTPLPQRLEMRGQQVVVASGGALPAQNSRPGAAAHPAAALAVHEQPLECLAQFRSVADPDARVGSQQVVDSVAKAEVVGSEKHRHTQDGGFDHTVAAPVAAPCEQTAAHVRDVGDTVQDTQFTHRIHQ